MSSYIIDDVLRRLAIFVEYFFFGEVFIEGIFDLFFFFFSNVQNIGTKILGSGNREIIVAVVTVHFWN